MEKDKQAEQYGEVEKQELVLPVRFAFEESNRENEQEELDRVIDDTPCVYSLFIEYEN
jgi:hypothetical protein